MKASQRAILRLGAFELDLKSGELRPLEPGPERRTIVLQEQPFRVLQMLIERAGEIATREDLKKKLWPNDTIVDFDHSINVAIGTLRRVLGDSAAQPIYIETVARRGYRLLVPTSRVEAADGQPQSESKDSSAINRKRSNWPAPSSARRSRTTACWRSSVAVAWAWCTRPKT
jgi:DNA-binding winged helix-turn-helix (wHTH) protein